MKLKVLGVQSMIALAWFAYVYATSGSSEVEQLTHSSASIQPTKGAPRD